MADPIQVSILPTSIWIEDTIWGARKVMLQHEGCEPFAYATFDYDWRYTSNAGTWEAAHRLARDLGAQEPVEHRPGAFPRIRWFHHALAWAYMLPGRLRTLDKEHPHHGN